MLGQVAHNFVRNPNYVSSIMNRAGNRHGPFENTLTVLQDPKNDRKLYLIGTTHSSTLLAYRTKKLIEKIQPDSIFVQTNKKWWDTVSQIKNVDTQSELNLYNRELQYSYDFDNKIENNFRGVFFKLRLGLWLWTINWYKRFNQEFHPFTPGLEMKFAIEAGQAKKIPVVLGGLAIDDKDLAALRVETRFDIFQVYRRFFYSLNQTSLWYSEIKDHYAVMDVQGGETFSESMDRQRLNWFIKFFEKISPYQKKVLVDNKDIDLFYALYRNCPGKNIVAVVNQWHMPGIEAHWKHTTGTQDVLKPINPIGNMDIEKYMEEQLVNDVLRAYTSKLGKTEPATHKNYITQYHKDNYEAERIRHVSFLSHDDPHQHHGLPTQFDDNLKQIDHHAHHHDAHSTLPKH